MMDMCSVSTAFAKACVDQSRFPLLPITSSRTLRNCRRLEANRRDVFVCSYPKSGTTWMQNIVYTLVTGGNVELDHISNYSPFYESNGTWDHDDDEPVLAKSVKNHQDAVGWRIFNTHLLPSMLPPRTSGAKFIYIVRNGRDVVCSFCT